MSMRKKIVLIIICLIIITGIFVRNVSIRLKNDENKNQEQEYEVVDEEHVTRAQTAKMLSSLFYTEKESSNLSHLITYEDIELDAWYDQYVNAIETIGLINEKEVESNKFRPSDTLTYEETSDIIDKFVLLYNKNVKNGNLTNDLITNGTKDFAIKKEKDEPILSSEWLIIYENIMNQLKNIGENTENSEAEESIFDSLPSIVEQEVFVVGTDDTLDNLEKNKVVTEDHIYSAKGIELKDKIDTTVKVLVSEEEIICVKEEINVETSLNNIYIKSNDNKNISVFINGYERVFEAQNKLSEDVQDVVGNLIIKDRKVTKLKIKPEVINSKVLVATKDYIELEDYGKLYLEESYKIYKVYGELSMEVTNGILVGYSNTDFVISDGKISAALIKEDIKAKNIRVLIKTNNYSSLFHSQIKLKVDSDFTVFYGEKKKKYDAGKTLTIKPTSKFLKEGRLRIETEDPDSRITILSIKRSEGNPSYRGSMEIATYDEGMTLINELPLEEYLYAVIPSEMPVSYGVESLKVQAICARSYAYNQLMANSYSNYGAHVDDSVSYQVYNNFKETDESILAVKDTYGKVIEYNNQIISAYYFSTSCGYTTSAKDVWGTEGELSYLAGKLQSDTADNIDLTSEKKFRKFIQDSTVDTYDKDFPWYRWKVTINAKNLKKSVDQNLRARYNANPNLIQTLVEEGSKKTYKSYPIDTVGEIKDIQILNRGTGGIITELLLVGSENTVKIYSEYNIRSILAPMYDEIIRQDKTTVNNLSMLPSAFFVVDKDSSDGISFTFTGGGYGHGVGMSQNGVKAMADSGKSYDDIIEHYYTGTDITTIYE